MKNYNSYSNLSILIPIFNWDITTLIDNLYNQCIALDIRFEIICIEDCSSKLFKNEKITKYKQVQYQKLKQNIGRSKIRNLLAKQANSDLLLFIDADSAVVDNKFIQQYLDAAKYINDGIEIIYGTTLYSNNKPPKNKLLHWKYGRNVESKRKMKIFSSHHFLCEKELFKLIKFDETINSYGYEDLYFAQNRKIKHVDIPLYHIGLKSTDYFLENINDSLLNIKKESANTRLQNTWINLAYIKLDWVVFIAFKLSKKLIIKNLKSKHPSMLLFQLYKLGLFCEIQIKSRKKR